MKMIQVSEDALDSIKKMAEQDAEQAAMYRFLREAALSDADDLFDRLQAANPEPNTPEEFDAAVRQAMQTK